MINPSNEPAKPKKIITIIPSGRLIESIPDTQPESDQSNRQDCGRVALQVTTDKRVKS